MFRVGDEVEWVSQSSGYVKVKKGRIVFVIPAGMSAFEANREIQPYWFRYSAGSKRNHESYLVRVGEKKELYWPLVKYLKEVPT